MQLLLCHAALPASTQQHTPMQQPQALLQCPAFHRCYPFRSHSMLLSLLVLLVLRTAVLQVYVFNIACVLFTATLLLKHFAKHWYHKWRTQIVFVLHIILTTL
jgi:hypothetical protein